MSLVFFDGHGENLDSMTVADSGSVNAGIIYADIRAKYGIPTSFTVP